ncbi:MAG: hypothetical protein CMJ41_00550 [Phycisphaerae bacterium]|nr:hypothetical protein [Phycisphaerae bacterium]HBZ96854.1 hypothetical protein [Phycisphaerales bacterium]
MRNHTMLAVLGFSLATPAVADTFIVDPAGNGDYLSIQTALRWAPDGSTIAVLPGVYETLGVDGRESNAVTVEAIDWAPAGSVVVQGGAWDAAAIEIGNGASITFRNLVVRTEGFTLVDVVDSDAVFEGCTLENAPGHGIDVKGQSNVTFADGTIAGMGEGGIRILHAVGTVTVVDSVLEGNRSDEGGAIQSRGSFETKLVVRRTDFIDNVAATHGGAIWIGQRQETAVVDTCRFLGNRANTTGGAIRAGSVSLQVVGTLISDNWAGIRGGGVALQPDGHVTQKFTDCMVTGNRSGSIAGGVAVDLFNLSSRVRFKGCEITDNVTVHEAGGIGNTGLGDVELYDSLLCGNLPDPATGNFHLSNTSVVDTCGVGACCLEELCVQLTQAACTEAAGTWHGANVHCEKVECTFETGACCYGSFCLLMTEWECGQHGGDWHGAGTLCADAVCDKPKPGDLDRDGKVDIGDLLKLFEYWGS